MSRYRILAILALVFTAGLTIGLACHAADTTSFTFLDDSAWSSTAIVMKFDGIGQIYTGRFKANLGNDLGINVFCTDFTHRINLNETYKTLANLGLVTDAAASAIKIDGEYFYATGTSGNYVGAGLTSAMIGGDYNPSKLGVLTAAQRASAVAFLGDNFLTGSLLTKQQYASVQSVIWDIIQDGGDGLGTGAVVAYRSAQNADGKLAFDMFGGYLGLAMNNLNYAAQTTSWIQDGSTCLSATGGARGTHRQDFIYKGAPPVPEPMSMVLVGIGLGAVAKLRRRGSF